MNPILAWWNAAGFATPSQGDLVQLGVAGGVVLVSLALGVLAGKRLGPAIGGWWRTHVAGHGEGVWTRAAPIVRHATAALCLSIALAAWPWPALAALPIGFTLGIAAGLVAHQVLRGLGLPRWTAWAIAAILFVALFSRSVGGLAAISDTLERIGFDVGRRRLSLLSLVSMLVTLVALYALVRFANRVAAHSIARAKGLDPAQKLIGVAAVVVAFFFGIDLIGLDLTSFAVFSGAFGLAIGFGLQKTVGNLIAGIILLMDRSIKPGDVIVVGEEAGRVNKIGVRAVSVITRDGKEHLIPNENLMTQEVENWSYSDRNVRVRIKVAVPYDCDLREAQALMLKAASDSPRVLDSPKPNVWLTSYGDYAVEHEILAWISDPEGGVGNVRSDVLNRLWWLFKDAGIVIPVPQRDVRLIRTAVAAD